MPPLASLEAMLLYVMYSGRMSVVFFASAISVSMVFWFRAVTSFSAAITLVCTLFLAMLRSIVLAFGLSAMYFSRSSTRFSGFFSAMAVLNALASSGSSCGVSAGFCVAAAGAWSAALGSGGFCPAPLCAPGTAAASATSASRASVNRRACFIRTPEERQIPSDCADNPSIGDAKAERRKTEGGKPPRPAPERRARTGSARRAT